jgi:hypothetical protein
VRRLTQSSFTMADRATCHIHSAHERFQGWSLHSAIHPWGSVEVATTMYDAADLANRRGTHEQDLAQSLALRSLEAQHLRYACML